MKIVAILLAIVSFGSAAQDRWTGKDKKDHFAISAAISAAGVGVGLTERQAFALSVGVGLAKEIYDSKPGGSGFSGKDLAWDIAGAYAGAKVGGLVIRRNFVGYTWRLK